MHDCLLKEIEEGDRARVLLLKVKGTGEGS